MIPISYFHNMETVEDRPSNSPLGWNRRLRCDTAAATPSEHRSLTDAGRRLLGLGVSSKFRSGRNVPEWDARFHNPAAIPLLVSAYRRNSLEASRRVIQCNPFFFHDEKLIETPIEAMTQLFTASSIFVKLNLSIRLKIRLNKWPISD